MDNKTVIVENFFNVGCNGDRTLKEEDLGWSDYMIREAQSDNPETIFRYVVEIVGLNILFYWVEDRNFYTIETELDPIEVRRIYDNPDWDGKTEYNKADLHGYGPHTYSKGEILATFKDPTEIWDNLKINGICIGDVLKRSAILDLD